MDSPFAWLHPFWAFAAPISASIPLGWFMFRMLDPSEARAGKGIDALPMLLCRLFGRASAQAMTWKQYAVSMLAFNAALFTLAFAPALRPGFAPLESRRKGLAWRARI